MHPSPSSRSLLPLSIILASLFTSIAAQYTFQGCYHINSTNNPLTLNDTSIYQSQGRCGGQICAPNNYAVFGMTSGQQCYCGNALPSDQVAGENCNVQCPGYPSNICTSLHPLSSSLLAGSGNLICDRRRTWIYVGVLDGCWNITRKPSLIHSTQRHKLCRFPALKYRVRHCRTYSPLTLPPTFHGPNVPGNRDHSNANTDRCSLEQRNVRRCHRRNRHCCPPHRRHSSRSNLLHPSTTKTRIRKVRKFGFRVFPRKY